MTFLLLVCLTLFVIGIGCVIRANFFFGEMVSKINQLRPAERAISLSGFARHRSFGVIEEYKRLYPDGKLVLKFFIWTAIAFAFLLGSSLIWLLWGAPSAGYIPRDR
jgi:hypothetical protein